MNSQRLLRRFANLNIHRPAFGTYPRLNSSASSNKTQAQPMASEDKKPLPLPEPSNGEAAMKLNVDGEGIKLDHLGPLVVHQDGTMSRIDNWAEMSEIEKQNTLRIIGKRNQQRLAAIKEKSQSQSQSQS